MTSQKKFLLNGKVIIESLPIAESANDIGLKRLLLDRGELAQFHDSSDPIHLIAYVEFPNGSIRGGHYHPNREERFYIIRGNMILAVQDVDTKELELSEIADGDVLFISPNVAHAIKTIKAGHAIEFSSKRFNAEGTIKFPSILEHLKD